VNLEQQLQEHFNRSSAQLTEPQERLEEVVTRGRRRRVAQGGIALAAIAALAFAVPTLLSPLARTRVELEAPATQLPDEEPPTSSDPSEPPGDTTTVGDVIGVADLGAATLGYKDRLLEVYNAGEQYAFEAPAPIDTALPDGSGGYVVKHGKEVNWYPSLKIEDGVFAVDVGDHDGDLILRTVLHGRAARGFFGSPDPLLLYSVVTPHQDPEQTVERFYAVTLAPGEPPELLETASAHESWVEGPVVAADGFVHGSCHLMCSLHSGLATEPKGSQTLYHGGGDKETGMAAISALTATPDGKVLGFVESHPGFPPSPKHPQVLVLLDGSSFKTLARIELPAGPNPKREWAPAPTVSLSADGQRVLVSTYVPTGAVVSSGGGSASTDELTATESTEREVRGTFLVEAALTANPRISAIDHSGVLRWMDAEAANQ
jgi:hypothetical protein